MEPTIHAGSLALTVPVNPISLSPGDIVAFASPNDAKVTILHRIDSIKSTDPLRFSTKGDANNSPDDWDVVDVGILGKYVFSIPYLGALANNISKPVGFIAVVIIPAVIFIILQIINIKKAIQQEIKKQTKNDHPPNIFPTCLIFTILVSLFTAKFAQAVFVDTVIVSGISISIADLAADTTPPVTNITTDLYHQSASSFDIAYTFEDDNPSYVELCTSYNLNEWSCENKNLENPIIFTPNQGNGVYCFDTIGHDRFDNVESINLPSSQDLDPLDPNLYCTLIN
jgi:signal peptidase